MLVDFSNDLIYNKEVDRFATEKADSDCPATVIGRIDTTEVSMFSDLTGRRFGKLTVLKLDHKKQQYSKDGKRRGQIYYWLCQCDCGNQKVIDGRNLCSKHATSCGCNYYKQNNKSKTRLYKVWDGMKGRCNYPTNNRYKNYGARGIKVCAEWQHNFTAFYEWAMANGYDENAPRGQYTIDRINVNGNYEPSNCRWIDNLTQQKNKCNRKANGEDVEPPEVE